MVLRTGFYTLVLPLKLGLLILTAFLAVLFFSNTARAASFDCNKAQTNFEQAICAEDYLSALDYDLGNAYRYALFGLSEEASDIVRNGQRSWHKHAQILCSLGKDSPSVAGATYDDSRIQCLQTAYVDRIKQLGLNKQILGHRFYTFDAYGAVAGEKSDDTDWVGSAEFSSLRIDGDSEMAKSFNQHMAELSAERGDSAGLANADASLHDSVALRAVTSYRISSVINHWDFYYGSAHGNFATQYDHFLVGHQRPLVATDIFAPSDWLAKLTDVIVPILRDKPGLDTFWDVDTVTATLASPAHWDFSKEGLVVTFSLYAIGPYAIGEPTVTIPWSQIKDMLAPSALRLVTGN